MHRPFAPAVRRRITALACLALAGALAVPAATATTAGRTPTSPTTAHVVAANKPTPKHRRVRKHKPPRLPVYRVGGAAELINPTAAMVADNFHLGGYGFASTTIAGHQVAGFAGYDRLAKGSLGTDGYGAHSRALAIGDGTHVIELAQIETQGYFSSYKQGPFGIEEIRRHAAQRINALHSGPTISPGQILVDSDHTHGGADTVGVWGGVPTSYLKLVHDRTVAALVEAYQRMRPANLYYGVAHAGVEGEPTRYPAPGNDPLLTNQFRNDPNNQVVDDELRVLQAKDPTTHKVIATYLNYSSHPTVLDSDNVYVTGDYPGVESQLLGAAYGGFGFDQVATLGRTQPARTGCPDKALAAQPKLRCELDEYAGRVLKRAELAVAGEQPLTGSPTVALQSYLIEDVTTNPILVAGSYGGYAFGAPIYRAVNPPWFTGDVLGTTAFSGRIGDILISGGPGEMYPQIVAAVRSAVKGMRGYLNIGTAGDFLGYIVYPLSAYPEPIRRSLFDGDPPPAGNTCSGVHSPVGCPDPVGNDNFFFNASLTFGTRLTCALLRGAGDVLTGQPRSYWSTLPVCRDFSDDLNRPVDVDTTYPDQPDLSAVLQH